MTHTLTYAENVKGWVSFYSYEPEWMIGMNNYFYTFKGGNLYRHNVGARNTFYKTWWLRVDPPLGAEAYHPSSVKSVFNTSPLENKLFKTLILDGDSTWDATLQTDIQTSGYVNSDFFEKKEQSYFAFIRNDENGQFSQRSLQGIGTNSTRTDVGTTATINFPLYIDLSNVVSSGNKIYWSDTAIYGGDITDVQIDIRNGINRLIVDTSDPNAVIPLVGTQQFYLYTNNSVAESHGVVGHYCVFEVENSLESKVELFTVSSEVMKSFP